MITDGNGDNGANNTPSSFESNVSIGGLLGGNNSIPIPNAPAPVAPIVTEQIVPPPAGQDPTLVAPIAPVVDPLVNDLPPNPESFEDIVKVLSSSASSPLKAEVFTLFKASQVDDKGNLVNKEGKVVLSSEKFKDFVDNDNLPVNERGDAINELGEIIKSKEQLVTDNSLIVPVKTAVETNFGIKFNETTEFPDTVEGIVNLVQESVKQLNTGAVKNYLESNPEIKGFAQHLALGGTIENYTASNINYKDINIKTLDETSKIEFLKRSFSLQGNPNSETLIDLIKKSGDEELNKHVGGALIYLDAKQKETNQHRDNLIKQQIQEEQKEDQIYWTNVEKTITNGNLNSIIIPIKERQGFLDYIAKPINDKNESAELQDMKKDSLEFDLLVSYLRYKQGDLSLLVDNLAKSKRVLTLQERANKLNNVNNGSGVPITTNTNTTKSSNVNITTLLGGGSR